MNEADNISDALLVKRFQAGDESAFDLLVERYAGQAYRIAYGVLANREDSEEVAQDVFVKVHSALKDFRGDSAFSTWMYRIALNLAKNKYRWNKSRGEGVKVSIDAPLETEDGDAKSIDIPDEGRMPDGENESRELQEALEVELKRLPEVYRTPLVMRNVDEVSYEEIARALGCKVGTVKSRINRGRSILKRKLGL